MMTPHMLLGMKSGRACMGSPQGVGVGLLRHLGAVWAVVGHASKHGQAGVHLQAQTSL